VSAVATATAAGCAVCGSTSLAPHLRVRLDGDPATLAADTTAYGHAMSDIARCAACGHMQLETMPDRPSLEEAYSGESEAAYVEEQRGQRATAARALARIERHVSPGALCDLGCWVGFLLAEARDRGWETLGVEPSRFASAYARERLGLDVRTGTLDDTDLPDGAFDAVVMGDVIEHLPDPHAELERVAGLLRPRGVVHLALPDAGSRMARALGARWWSVLPTHVHYFTRASLARLLDRAGFVVEWVGTAPKAFSVEYYAGRLEGYSPAAARAATGALRAAGLADRLVCPDFRDRMAVVARVR
jgi:SAM-dependent methyltransferase